MGRMQLVLLVAVVLGGACSGTGGEEKPKGEDLLGDLVDDPEADMAEMLPGPGDLTGDKATVDVPRGDGSPDDLRAGTDLQADAAMDVGVDTACVPSCSGLECGVDGCGGSCGSCSAPKELCVEGRCQCPEGTHEGGAGNCLMAGQCDPGYGILPGEAECKEVSEVCPSQNPCEYPVSWHLGVCEFQTIINGTPCQPASPGPCAVGAACQGGECKEIWAPCQALRPIILVHGINGSSENFAVMRQRLVADGWPENYIFSFDAADPKWGCNVDNAAAIQALVKQAMEATCQPRVDLVAHSMGTLSSRYFVKNLGGSSLVNTYVTLGGMHHGLLSSCFAPDFLGVCVWQELCEWGDYIKQLNESPATPGPCNWVSIYSTGDQTVPADSSELEGAENIQFEGVAHDGETGLLQDPAVYAEVKRVLQYPCW